MRFFSSASLSFFIVFLFLQLPLSAQLKFYEASFNGGVTVGGYSPGAAIAPTPAQFTIYIEPGSSIKKAYLFVGRIGNVAPKTVTLNGKSYTIDSTLNQVTPSFWSRYGGIGAGGTAAVNAIDVTADIDPAITTYTFTNTFQAGASMVYQEFILYVAYENTALPVVNTAIFLNTLDNDSVMTYNNLPLSKPFDNTADIGLSVLTGFLCSYGVNDSRKISVNSTLLGTLHGNEVNSGVCGGPIGSFYYQNKILTGMNGDNANQAMQNTDALSNIKNIVTNGSNTITLKNEYGGGPNPNVSDPFDDHMWGLILAYGGGCVNNNAFAGKDSSICFGDNILLQATGGNTYSWTPNSSISNPSISNPSVSPTITTTYTVMVTDALGCNGTDSVKVVVNSLPVVSITGKPVICIGEKDTLTALATGGSPSYNYSWSGGSSNDSIVLFPTTSGNYTLTVTDAKGCETTKSYNITVNPKPLVTAGTNTTITSGQSITLSSSGGNTYSWLPSSSFINPSIPNPSITPTITSTYTVIVSDVNGCTDSSTVTITVTEPIEPIDSSCGKVFLPTAFSPNGDGVNDNFECKIQNSDCIISYHLMVYDRWGEKVFETSNPKDVWDGSYKNKIMDAAVFDYFLDAELTTGEIISKKGNVTLMK